MDINTGIFIFLATLAGGVVSVSAAALLALPMLSAWAPRLVSFAVGVLLANALLHLLPEAAEGLSVHTVGMVLLVGILIFFTLEKMALWRHDHQHGHHGGNNHGPAVQEIHPVGLMIVVGDGLHNFVDGILIAAAFLQDPALGISTALAVIIHEIPQEIGDFMVLLGAGYSRSRALMLNILASLTAVAGGLIGWLALSQATTLIPYVLALAAASFLYIAVADLMPLLQRQRRIQDFALQLALLLSGLLVVGFH